VQSEPASRLSLSLAKRCDPPNLWTVPSAAALVTEAGRWSSDHLREAAAEISASILRGLRPEVLKAEAAAR
jgi:hypothetical protein